MKNGSEKKIFISYRVQDTAGETGRLVDALKQHFADDQLFMDIENLEPGADFTDAIEHSLSCCDVFLAVIGPRWTGLREGQPSRINEPTDWVRLEVATALQRNVRVVPLLVDGGVLPTTEDLPPDLQPLLRRQTLEISNKRWRYDTDQLIRFLVNTVGIVPRRATAQRAVATAPKKNKTWLYVGGGFALAIVVLIIIGSLIPEEKAVANPEAQTTTSGTTVPQSILPTTSTETEAEYANIAGTWQEVDEGLTATFVLTQSGTQVSVQASMGGEAMGNGSGVVSGRTVDLNVPLLGVATNLRGTVSDDGNSISGTYTVPATGAAQPFKLVRR